jgi:hypothetical protein
LNVLVPAIELGNADHVAQTHLVRPVALSRLDPGPAATVSKATLNRILDTLGRVFR